MKLQSQLQKKVGIIASVIVVFGVVGVTIFQESNDGAGGTPVAVTKTTVPVSSPTPVTTNVATPPPATVPKNYTSVYKDGTYSATGSYDSPGGTENISVTLTLSNDIITSVSVTSGAYDRRSQSYQNIFIANYKQYVIGKNIANVNLGKISSSSLTPIGFNDALAQIKAQAKA